MTSIDKIYTGKITEINYVKIEGTTVLQDILIMQDNPRAALLIEKGQFSKKNLDLIETIYAKNKCVYIQYTKPSIIENDINVVRICENDPHIIIVSDPLTQTTVSSTSYQQKILESSKQHEISPLPIGQQQYVELINMGKYSHKFIEFQPPPTNPLPARISSQSGTPMKLTPRVSAESIPVENKTQIETDKLGENEPILKEEVVYQSPIQTFAHVPVAKELPSHAPLPIITDVETINKIEQYIANIAIDLIKLKEALLGIKQE